MTALEQRRVPPLGGFNLTFLAVEIRRLFRNRRTLIITLVVPVVLTLLFRTGRRGAALQATQGVDYQALITIGLAVYGAMLAATSGGAIVSVERALGWSRQLRLTPLRPPAYIAIKLLVAMTLGLISVVAVFVVSAIEGVQLSISVWVLSGVLAWVGALVFAAFGLFMGYLLPTENVMQFLGLGLALLSFAGGLFIPLSQFPQILQDIAQWTPLYGLNQLVHAPMLGVGVQWAWAVNAVAWLVIFAGGAVWRFRKDTARV